MAEKKVLLRQVRKKSRYFIQWSVYLIQKAWVGTEFLAGEPQYMICSLGWSRD